MKLRIFVGGFALAAGFVAVVGSAQAADLPMRPAPAPMAPVAYAPPVYNWSGFYIGGNIGGGFADSSWTDPLSGGTNSFNKNGFIGGGQIGYNLQYNWFVIGLEGDFDWTGLKGSSADSIGDQIGTKTEWTATATGRVGAAFDRLLVYGKGGIAFAQNRNTFTDAFGVSAASTNNTRTGWTAGAGLEYALTQNWTAKLEYDYLGFGKETLNFATPNIIYASNASLNVQEIKAGINYKFSW
jgi:outer membrane immunogenic protein